MATGGKAQGVYVVTDADIAAGRFRVAPGPATRVVGMDPATRGVEGGPSTPVYVVSDPSARGVIGGKAIPMSNLTGIRVPVHDLAVPVYVESDPGEQFGPAPPPAPYAPICNYTIGYFPLDEASGAPINVVPGGLGTVQYAPTVPSDVGKIAGARGPYADGVAWSVVGDEYVLIDSLTQSFSVWGWGKQAADEFNAFMGLDDGGGAGNRSWLIFAMGTSLFSAVFWGPSDNIVAISAPITPGQFFFWIFKFDHTTQKCSISVDGGAWVESATAMGGVMQTNPTWAWYVGINGSTAFNGLHDEVGFALNYAATDEDRDMLWNGGDGETWSGIAAAGEC